MIINRRLNGGRSLLRGIDTYNAETETALRASIAAAAGVDASEVDIESVAFPVKVWMVFWTRAALFHVHCQPETSTNCLPHT
jgi:hypothetical protein